MMASCKDITRLLSQASDRDLAWGERIQVRLHLLYCHGCRQFEKQLRFLRVAARRLAQLEDLSNATRLPQAARDRIQNAIRRLESE